MTTFLFLLFLFADVQHPKLAIDGIEKDFVVTQLVEQSLTGCAENPQGGGFNGDPLTVDLLKSPEPTDQGVNSTWFSGNVSGTENSTLQPMSMRVVPAPDPNPNPDPPMPPVSATPEPSTAAILGITVATLLFLLFGRRYGRRLARRI